MLNFDDKLCRGLAAYDNMAKLHNLVVNADNDQVTLTITAQGRFGKTFLFLIPCLRHIANEHGKTIVIHVSKEIYNKLGTSLVGEQQSTLPLKASFEVQLIPLKDDDTTLSLAQQIVVKDISIKMSERLEEDMINKIGEVFNNAREHSNARHVLAGRYLNYHTGGGKGLCFICYDTGVGIVQNVRNRKNEMFSDREALEWALAEYNSTAATTGIARGQGLELLSSFARANRGIIRICTGNILYTYDCRNSKQKTTFQELKHTFCGTLFEMYINPDARQYHYKGESR